MTADVAIVGYGPVGQLLAILLGQRGWRVHVVERWPEPYPLPRAVHFDHEVGAHPPARGRRRGARRPHRAGADLRVAQRDGRDADPLRARHGAEPVGLARVEHVLPARARAHSRRAGARAAHGLGRTRRRGRRRCASSRTASRSTRSARTAARTVLRARFAVGCDGANSFVRERLGSGWHDLGFHFDWLVVDVLPSDPRWPGPINWQLCDPARPTTLVSGGPGRRRFEFMRLPRRDARGAEQRGRRPGACSGRGASIPATPSSSATPSTPSARAGRIAGATAARCSRATPRTRCRPSRGRACARGCATPRTWPGSSTWCCAAWRARRLLDTLHDGARAARVRDDPALGRARAA